MEITVRDLIVILKERPQESVVLVEPGRQREDGGYDTQAFDVHSDSDGKYTIFA